MLCCFYRNLAVNCANLIVSWFQCLAVYPPGRR